MPFSLKDFGYAKNRGGLLGGPLQNVERPLLIVLCDHFGQRRFSRVLPGGQPDLDYYRNRFFADSPFLRPDRLNASVNEFFREISNGRFTWKPTDPPVVVVTLPQNEARLPTIMRRGIILGRLQREGLFDFAPYSGTPAGLATEVQISVIVLDTDSVSGAGQSSHGMHKWDPDPETGDDSWNTVFIPVGLIGDDPSVQLASHELTHGLAFDSNYPTPDYYWLGIDLYYPGALHTSISLMGPSSDTPGDPTAFHLDPWHKLIFGWHEPRMVPMNTAHAVPLELVAPAASDPAGAVLFYDDGKAPFEYFLLEYRNRSVGNFDDAVASNGLAIWHVKTDDRHRPIQLKWDPRPDLPQPAPPAAPRQSLFNMVFCEAAGWVNNQPPVAVPLNRPNEGFQPGGNLLWGPGAVTPTLRWVDGASTGFRLSVRWFGGSDSRVIVDVHKERLRFPGSGTTTEGVPGVVETTWVARNNRPLTAFSDVFVHRADWSAPTTVRGLSLVKQNTDPVLLTGLNGYVDVFWVGDDGAIWLASRPTLAMEWIGAQPITARNVADGQSRIRVVARNVDHLDVFWSRADGTLMSTWRDLRADNGSWANHTFELAAASQARPWSVAAVGTGPEELFVFWVGTDKALWSRRWGSVDNVQRPRWQAAARLVASSEVRTDTAIAAVSKQLGEIDYFWVGPDGSLRTAHRANGGWQTARTLSQPGDAALGCDVAAIALDEHHLDVYWVNPGEQLRWASGVRYPSGGPWNDPQTLPMPAHVHPKYPIGAAGREGAHRDVTVALVDRRVCCLWWDDPRRPFQRGPASLAQRPGAGDWHTAMPFGAAIVREKV